MNPNYWLVGATWSGESQADAFYRRGYWELGWDDQQQPAMAQQRDSIKAGDRIAVKSMLGQGSPDIAIRGLGVVKEVGEDKRVYIDWLVEGLNRIVPSRGCYKAIHGPYSIPSDEEWLGKAFRI